MKRGVINIDPRIVGASWFQSFGYCEYKFYLHKVKGFEVEVTKKIKEGVKIHSVKEEEFVKEAVPTTWLQFIKSKELTITKEVDFFKQIGDIMLLGRIDEIAVDKNKILIIDDKPNAYPYDSVKLQLFAYCYLFKENFKEQTKPIFAVLRDRDKNMIVWQQEFSKKEGEQFFEAFYRIRSILLGNEEPVPTNNPNKCRMCQFKDVCKFSLAKD